MGRSVGVVIEKDDQLTGFAECLLSVLVIKETNFQISHSTLTITQWPH